MARRRGAGRGPGRRSARSRGCGPSRHVGRCSPARSRMRCRPRPVPPGRSRSGPPDGLVARPTSGPGGARAGDRGRRDGSPPAGWRGPCSPTAAQFLPCGVGTTPRCTQPPTLARVRVGPRLRRPARRLAPLRRRRGLRPLLAGHLADGLDVRLARRSAGCGGRGGDEPGRRWEGGERGPEADPPPPPACRGSLVALPTARCRWPAQPGSPTTRPRRSCSPMPPRVHDGLGVAQRGAHAPGALLGIRVPAAVRPTPRAVDQYAIGIHTS